AISCIALFWSASRETTTASGVDWWMTSKKNSYRAHSASNQTESTPRSRLRKGSRVESMGSTIAIRFMATTEIKKVSHCCPAACRLVQASTTQARQQAAAADPRAPAGLMPSFRQLLLRHGVTRRANHRLHDRRAHRDDFLVLRRIADLGARRHYFSHRRRFHHHARLGADSRDLPRRTIARRATLVATLGAALLAAEAASQDAGAAALAAAAVVVATGILPISRAVLEGRDVVAILADAALAARGFNNAFQE